MKMDPMSFIQNKATHLLGSITPLTKSSKPENETPESLKEDHRIVGTR